ncbi:MAG: hypothetical protein KDA85_22205 [Planctomycetaceae bacterium]|nr:hypothetical protein [Planctomycetaceae bacterium]
MRKTCRIVAGVAITVVVLIAAVVIEARVRSQSGGPMVIHGIPVSNAEVRGTWAPDFLWAGREWQLDIKSEVELELRLDGGVYFIPRGSHSIYSNHDHTNTGRFGGPEFWRYPEEVEVRSLDGKL